MKESSTESRTRDENQAEKEAACGDHRGGLFFVLRAAAEQLASVYFLLTDQACRVCKVGATGC
jgi:hypothetical protein